MDVCLIYPLCVLNATFIRQIGPIPALMTDMGIGKTPDPAILATTNTAAHQTVKPFFFSADSPDTDETLPSTSVSFAYHAKFIVKIEKKKPEG